MTFPIETKRLQIRPFIPEDLEAFHSILGDPKVMEHIPGGPSTSIEKTKQTLGKIIALQESFGFSQWAIILKGENKIVGDCGLIPVEGKGPDIEVTYDVASDYWGKGIATEAAGAVIDYGFSRLELNKIIGITYPWHKTSIRVLEKCGMIYFKKSNLYGHEMVVYEISKK